MIKIRLVAAAALAVICGLAIAQETTPAAAPTFVSVLPPLIAIGIALALKQVIPALFLGVWFGAWAVHGLDLNGLWSGLLDTTSVYVKKALANEDHAAIILFSLMIGGMVGIISRNGGMQGIVNNIMVWATSARRASAATGVMGLAVFFDDYANTLVVGNTMRPVTDRLRVSREKLAYIVDSTAAPVACLAFVTTWIGYEVGLIDDALTKLGSDMDGYAVFLNSLAYSFYPILAIAFVFMIAITGNDFGAMLKAERRARSGGEIIPPKKGNVGHTEEVIEPIDGRPQRAINAVAPVLVLIVSVMAGLYSTGLDADNPNQSIRDIVGNADSYAALMWGSLLGALTAAFLSIVQGVLTTEEVVDAWYRGVRSMMMAMIVLVLAWSLSDVTEQLHTAQYLASVLGDSLPPGLLPALVFLLAAATAFATGSSWGTMGILMPLIIPLIWAVLGAGNIDDPIFYSSVACVLAGAVWGDHCSPISDTTILSSMASGCDHIEHVRTQLPYAMLVGMVSLLVATLPTAFGVPWWLALGLAGGLLFFILRMAGSDPEAEIA